MFLRPASGWPAAPSDINWGIGSALLCLVGAQVAGGFWFALTSGAVYGGDPVPADAPIWTRLVFNLGLWAGYFIGPLLVRRLTNSKGDDFVLRTDAAEFVAAAVIGVLTQIAVLPLLYVIVTRVLDGDPAGTAQDLVDRIDGPFDVVLLTLAVVVIGPVVEEWFYRGMLLPTLCRRFGVWAGVIGSSAVFALVHQEVILLPGLFLFAAILAWLTIATGRIGPAVVAHMAFNATTLVLLLT